MSLTAPFVPDTVAAAFGAVIQTVTPAQFIALYGAGNTKTPTANFSAHFRGQTMSFQKNVPFVTTPDLLNALTSQSAPIV